MSDHTVVIRVLYRFATFGCVVNYSQIDNFDVRAEELHAVIMPDQ